MADIKRSEDVLGKNWDRCLSDTIIKIGGGLGVGLIFSVFIFKRRPWPIAFGAGLGVGMGYSNCQNEFRDPYNLHGKIVKVLPAAGVLPSTKSNTEVNIESKPETNT
ncbi:MICOS complex subunit Mic10-like [Anneissia japonica]|uniref:MICOS complex subunit Mic10-like n=1 Tax=Anneissia japonica TaxID=1529436 RepID=UPI001425501A|nr:MICOS complex subunit Mic10-like [Anneissia japonica]